MLVCDLTVCVWPCVPCVRYACVRVGLVTETDVDVGQLAQKHALTASAVTDLLELVQRVVSRNTDEDEPFALNFVALKSRLTQVRGFDSGLGTSKASSARAPAVRVLLLLHLIVVLICLPKLSTGGCVVAQRAQLTPRSTCHARRSSA
jgi:hypothetical protein